jgi:hypothetical protein
MNMDRKEFAMKLLGLGACPFFLSGFLGKKVEGAKAAPLSEECQQVEAQKKFIENWLTDLLDTMEKVVDRETQVKLIEGCGQGCFRRHQFKVDIAEKGKGDLDKLIEAYKQNFEIWKDGDKVRIRFGEVSNRCYCPVVQNLPPKPNDIHCECTKATHQSIFEVALGRPIKIDIVQTLRRGGITCEFLVHI